VSDEFERRIELVLAAVTRAARALEPAGADPGPTRADHPERPAEGRAQSLARALRLTNDEVDLVWTVVARAVDPRIAPQLRTVFGADARPGVSVAQQIAIAALSTARSRSLLAILDPRHPLRAHGLVIPAAQSDEPYDVTTRWTAPLRLCGFLRGDDRLDPTVSSVGGLVMPVGAPQLSAAQTEILTRLAGWLAAPEPTTIVLEGAGGSGRRVAVALAAGSRPVIAVDFTRISPRRAEAVLFALRREVLLLGAIPVLANLDELWSRLAPGDDTGLGLAAILEAMTGPVVVTTSTPGIDLHAATRMVLRMRWPLPDMATRNELWIRALHDALTDEQRELVALRYEMGAGGIYEAARSATHRAEQRGAARPALDDVVAGVQDNIAERLGELAQRVEVRQDWSELALSADAHDDVRALIGRIRHAHLVLDGWGFRRKLARGTGVAALFSGPPGTGKTMVAGLLARELQLELYQVDLSRIVSKWVGETEKQLSKVFEAAEAGHALLLFDEADALFAKRSAEVKSAVDRYANLEVNYLLQRVESFGGVVILTTNLDTSIDPALRRRLASHIVFSLPDLEERRRLWESMLATGVEVASDVDLDVLADEFDAMTGANIRNAVLSAAFLAASERRTIDASHLRRAARGEYRAMGRVLSR
jgi:ATPase family protein associated with various cellular activities (AAA)